MKPFIGITPLLNEETNDFWMYTGYLNSIIEAGGIPVVLPMTEDAELIKDIAEKFDGFLFTGGPDIDPVMYGGGRYDFYGESSKLRDRCEKALFDQVERRKKPILGICRGLQFINVVCGGTLYQDILEDGASIVCHRMEKPYNRPQHNISIYPDTPLHKTLGTLEIGVNSCHHQAICELAPCLDPMALSPDGYIESFYMPGARYVQGFQWHPEMYPEDENSKKIFASFIKACRDDNYSRNKNHN